MEGLDQLLKKLDKLGGDLGKSTAKAELRAGAVIQGRVKQLCPVDTGQLRESIGNERQGDVTVVGTSVEHAIFVEYGTGKKGDPTVPHTTKEYWRYKGKGGNWVTSHGQVPRPFMRNGFSQSKDQAVQAYADSIRSDIKEMMK